MKSGISVVLLIFCSLSGSSVYASDGQQVPSMSYKEHADKVETMFMWAVGGLGFIFSAVGLLQGLNAKAVSEEVKELREHAKKVKEGLDGYARTLKGEIDRELATSLSSLLAALTATMQLNEVRLRLTREITDLDEPSVYHPLPATDKAAILQFLRAVETQKEALKKAYSNFKEMPGFSETIMDLRTVGKARHYVFEFGDAIAAFEQEKKLIEQEIARAEGNQDLQEALQQDLYKVFLHLGHSYAGQNDYHKAILNYNEIRNYKNFRDLRVQVPLSKAYAYREMEKLEEAIKSCEEARTNSGLSPEIIQRLPGGWISNSIVRCYWEAVYEGANSYTALGDYKAAAPLYETAIELYNTLRRNEPLKDLEYVGALVWLHMSYGECLFKWGGGNVKNAEIQYEESLKIIEREIPYADRGKFKGPILYRQGRLYVSNGNFKDAEEKFSEIEEYSYDIPYEKYEFDIYYGYTLLRVNADNNDKKNKGRDKIDQAVKVKEEKVKEIEKGLSRKAPDYDYELCDPRYQLAMGWAMQDKEHETKAIKELKKLTTDPYNFLAIKEWAKAACSVDFVNLRGDPEFRKVVGLPAPD